jgi:hypothetical protein
MVEAKQSNERDNLQINISQSNITTSTLYSTISKLILANQILLFDHLLYYIISIILSIELIKTIPVQLVMIHW